MGGFTLDAAETIASELRMKNEEWRNNPDNQSFLHSQFSILNLLKSLLAQSLLQQVAEPDGEPRFIMLETIREYALERLEASGEGDLLRRQHAAFYLALAETAEPKVQDATQDIWLNRLEHEHDNLRAALGWALAGNDLEVDQARKRIMVVLVDARVWQRRTQVAGGSAATKRRCRAGNSGEDAAGKRVHLRPHRRAAIRCVRRAGAGAFSRTGRHPGARPGLWCIWPIWSGSRATISKRRSWPPRAWRCFASWATTAIVFALHKLGDIVRDQGDYKRAGALLEESLATWRALNHDESCAFVLNGLGDAER